MSRLNKERALLAELKFQLVSIAAELKFRKLIQAIKAGFNPSQPRDERGRWTGGSGGLNDPRVISDATPDGLIPGAQYAANGHHFVPRGVFMKEKYDFPSETLKVLETGRLKDPTSNQFDRMHREYNKAVEEALDDFIRKNNIERGQMTPGEARSFSSEIKTSRDPRISQFNRRVYMREIMRSLRYFRGRE